MAKIDPALKKSLDQLDQEKRKKHKKGCLKALLIVLVVLTGLIGSAYLVFLSPFAFPGLGLKGELGGQINILVLGRGGEGHSGANLTDTIMMVIIRPGDKRVAMLSIPRDLWVSTPKYGESKINAVFSGAKNAGKSDEAAIQLVKQQVEEITGFTPNYYALIDFEGMEKMVDAVGGIDVKVDTEFNDTLHKIHYKKGRNHFDGKQAVMYSRARYADSGEGSDFQRADRQQDVIMALKDKAMTSEVLLNPGKLSALYEQYQKNIITDISLRELSRLRVVAGELSDEKTIKAVYSTANVLVSGKSGGGAYILKPKSGDWAETRAFAKNIFKDQPTVMILNGTKEAGKAKSEAESLKAAGYNILGPADADRHTYIQTMVYDNKGRYHREAQKLADKYDGLVANSKYESQQADLVVVLGQGEIKTSWFTKLWSWLTPEVNL